MKLETVRVQKVVSTEKVFYHSQQKELEKKTLLFSVETYCLSYDLDTNLSKRWSILYLQQMFHHHLWLKIKLCWRLSHKKVFTLKTYDSQCLSLHFIDGSGNRLYTHEILAQKWYFFLRESESERKLFTKHKYNQDMSEFYDRLSALPI